MAQAKNYRLGVDEEGVFHIQAQFEDHGPMDLRYKWRTGFILYQEHPELDDPPGAVPEASALRWGIWDERRVLWATDNRQDAIQAIDALLEKGYYLADTLLPEVMEGYTEGSAILLVPPIHQDRIKLTPKDRGVLEEQRATLVEAD